jgi:hypothetical protein
MTTVFSALVFASWRNTVFTLTAAHLDYRYGLVWQVQRRIQLNQIRTVDIEYPLFGRPIGVRAMTFSTANGPTKLAYLGSRAATGCWTQWWSGPEPRRRSGATRVSLPGSAPRIWRSRSCWTPR